MADTWQVVRRRNGRESVLFDGGEDDARQYLSQNYPRVHVEPGSPDPAVPDALLKSPAGDYESCVGTMALGSVTVPRFINTDEDGTPEDSEDPGSDDDEDDSDVVVPPAKTTAAKKTAAKKTAAPAFGGNA